MKLVESIRYDIMAFLHSNNELLFNERDFQMHLVLWLRKSANKYDDVDLEYYIPSGVLNLDEQEEHVFGEDLRIDIVVKKDEEYCPIELKYKTREIKESITRFGEELSDITVMKNQSARDLGMYGFWRDVRRVELIRNRFDAVKNGLVVFLTNDFGYKDEKNIYSKEKKPNHVNFSMSNGLHSICKHWIYPDSACAKKYKGFKVKEEYCIDWVDTKVEYREKKGKENKYINFCFCILTI